MSSSNVYSIEKGLISKILETRDLSAMRDNQITESYFSGTHKQAYKFIFETTRLTGEVPTVRVFENKFPNYELDTIVKNKMSVVGTEESLTYWCGEIRNKKKHNTIAQAIEDAAKNVEDLNTEDALKQLKKAIAYIDSEVEVTSTVDITKNTDLRKEAYLRRKISKGMIGIPSGNSSLDFFLKGFVDETLTTIIANTGIGKTWLEIFIGASCMLNNYKVYQGVTEMSEDIMRDRYEAMLFGKCYGELNYNQFKSGSLSLKQEKRYFEFLENDLPNFEPLIIGTATGVMALEADIIKYDPDIILIDSAYLMEDDQGAKDDWLRVAHITRDLKRMAKRLHKPIIINTQADKNTSKKTGPGLESIMFTQAIGQDSDNVISMFRDEIMKNDNEMCVQILKQREGILGRIMMMWDFTRMCFDNLYSDYNDESNVDDVDTKDNPRETTEKAVLKIDKNLRELV